MFELLKVGVIDPSKGVNLTQSIIAASESFSTAFIEVGKGVGGLCLLFVAFYYLLAILEGGKFQIKMLFPLVIYFGVCNFGAVANTAVGFTQMLTSAVLNECESARKSYMSGACGGEECNTLLSMFLYKCKEDLDAGGEEADQYFKDNLLNGGEKGESKEPVYDGSGTGTGGDDVPDDESVKKGFVGRTLESIGDALKNFGNRLLCKIVQSINLLEFPSRAFNYTFIGFVCMILQLLTSLFGYAIMAFGAMLTGIIVAFGPIAWSFAVFPGRGKYIGSWFLRLCQYSLWAPLVALMNCFTVVIFNGIADSSSGITTLFLLVVFIANICALLEVPSIAQLIIEGVTGGPSISSALHTVESIAGKVLMNNLEAGRDAQQTELLQSINNKLPDLNGGGNGGSGGGNNGGGNIQGNNPFNDFGHNYNDSGNGPGTDYSSE